MALRGPRTGERARPGDSHQQVPAGTERACQDRGLSPPRLSGRPLTVPDLLASAVSTLSEPGCTRAADMAHSTMVTVLSFMFVSPR